MQQDQGAGPVNRFADRRDFLQIHFAQFLNECDQLLVEAAGDIGHPGLDNLALQISIRKRNVQVQAATLQCITDFSRIVTGKEDQRFLVRYGFDRADFRNRQLIVREHFKQQGFELVVGLVDLVNEQNATVLFFQRF